jgi:uncharacterized protein (DUF4415 family)
MQKTIKTRSGREVIVPTSQENAAINAGIAADPDTYELGAAEFTRLRRVGRPPVAIKRPMLSMRTDPDVLEKLRASGPGWQTRVNALLREAVEHGRL